MNRTNNLQDLRKEYEAALAPLKQKLQNATEECEQARNLLSEKKWLEEDAWDLLEEEVYIFETRKSCIQRQEIGNQIRREKCEYFSSTRVVTPIECDGCKNKHLYEHFLDCRRDRANIEKNFNKGGYQEKVIEAESKIKECNNKYLPQIEKAKKQNWGIFFPLVNYLEQQSKNDNHKHNSNEKLCLVLVFVGLLMIPSSLPVGLKAGEIYRKANRK